MKSSKAISLDSLLSRCFSSLAWWTIPACSIAKAQAKLEGSGKVTSDSDLISPDNTAQSSFQDFQNMSVALYCRLTQLDLDGRLPGSGVPGLKGMANLSFSMHPIPASSISYVQSNIPRDAARLLDVARMVVLGQQFATGASFGCSGDQPGAYLLQVSRDRMAAGLRTLLHQ